MLLQESTYKQQSDLAHFCRTGELAESVIVRPDRVHHYRRLVYNIVDDSLESAFPLAKNLLTDEQWDTLVNNFFATHKCMSAQIWEMPKEFYNYFKDTESPMKNLYPQLEDLLFFEWMEIEVFMMEDIVFPQVAKEGNILSDTLAVNPEFRIFRVSYPVHLKIAKEITQDDKGAYYILLFREKETGRVQFIDLSAVYVLIIENIAKGLKLEEILTEISRHLKLDSMEVLFDNVKTFVEMLQVKGFVLGFYSDSK
jgi:hypothetical protein